jgi:ribosomal protein S18 acetylase RimI-like enzyme
MGLNYRFAVPADIPGLARMNQQLIRDEGHRNRMAPAELEARMAVWLAGEYRAVVFEDDGEVAGYALYRHEPDGVYLRQFLVLPEQRRKGIGLAALRWLQRSAWQNEPRVRVEVLVGNAPGIAFWRAVGFSDYCITMERELRSPDVDSDRWSV